MINHQFKNSNNQYIGRDVIGVRFCFQIFFLKYVYINVAKLVVIHMKT
jgi:hypothetical protein